MKIKRTIFDKIEKYISSDKILILRGPRQVGKTTLMKDLQKTINNDKTIFLNLDNLDLIGKIKTVNELIIYLKFEYDYMDNEKIFLFLDEFQNIKNAGLFLKNIYDEYPNIKLICSGSSSLEITKSTEFLTGRKFVFDISSFSFEEYLQARSFKNYDKKFNLETEFDILEQFYKFYEKELNIFLEEYITIGGYPEVVLNSGEKRQMIISDIIDTYIKKDIIQFLKVENILAFNNLIKVLSSQIGNLVNKTEVNGIIGTGINTLNKYLDILVGTYIFRFVSPFYTNVRKEMSKMQKVFCLDLGMRNYILYGNIDKIAISDYGALIENFIYNELYLKENNGINIYQTVSKAEIDFIFQIDYNNLIPIEVKYRNKVNFPKVMSNFEEKYFEKINKKIIFTKNIIKKEDNTYYIPSSLIGFLAKI